MPGSQGTVDRGRTPSGSGDDRALAARWAGKRPLAQDGRGA